MALIGDGDANDYEHIAREWHCSYIAGDHLYDLQSCDLYIRRLLETMLRGDEEYLFKIDPDTMVARRFKGLPAISSVFGTLETVSEAGREPIYGPPNVQGGCIGMTRDVVEELLKSPHLSRSALTDDCLRTWARCGDMLRTVAKGAFSDDFVLSWLASTIGVPLISCDEIRSQWRESVDNHRLSYAVTHPHKVFSSDGSAL